MNSIIFNVNSNRLEIEKDTYTTGGSVNFDGCVFNFDSTWDGFVKTAVFGFGNSDYVRADIVDNMCVIPSVCIRNEGILKIGVYGINSEGTVITTNAVAHRVNEGIGEENNWYEEDNLFIHNALKELEESLEKYKSSLETRFNDLMKLIRNEGSISDSDVLPGEPDEWYTPSDSISFSSLPSATGNEKYQAYLDCCLNELTVEFPEYVSSKEIGMDDSGEFPIYAYIFEPLNYEKTILITSCFHAESDITLLSLSHYLNELCRNFSADRTLAYFRSKVKLVVVPVANPYGFVNSSKLNANGVDLQRNFPYKWEECLSEVKGDSPASCSEISAVFEIVDEIYEDKFCAALDLNAGLNTVCGGMVFYPRFKDNCIDAISDALCRYNYETEDEAAEKKILAASINPSFGNFLADTFRINTCSVQWSPYTYSGKSTAKIIKYSELIGNLLYALAQNSSMAIREYELPFVKHFSWRSSGEEDVYNVPLEEGKIPISSYEVNVSKPCCVCLTGYVLIKAGTDCKIKINPILWQDSAPEQGYDERVSMQDFSIEMPISCGVQVVPLESVLQAYASNRTEELSDLYPGKISFTIVAEADSEDVSVIGFSATLRAFKSNAGKAVEISRPMGCATDYTEADDMPTQVVVYPAETVTERDARYND